MFDLKSLFGNRNDKALRPFLALVPQINALEDGLKTLSDDALREKTAEFKNRLGKGEALDALLPEAFAVVREAARRTLKERHFDVQLVGGMILHHKGIAEMRTGEGKTLVATLPAYLNALTGKGVHVVTVNDYLSRRDAVWMGQIYSALGLSVGVLNHDSSFLYDPAHRELDEKRDEVGSFKVVHEFLRPCSRQEAYRADITYGTNSEFGFDYLRDNLEYDAKAIRERGYHFAIVDEIDSILIDEARTPLIISSATGESEDLYVRFADIAGRLSKDADYGVDEKLKAITLTPVGIEKTEKILGIENLYTEGGVKFVHHLETAVRAKALYQKDVDYVVKEDEVIIVDTFTGRLQPGRRWSEGLHQAVEAKEGVKIQKESRTFASITYQNFFRMYEKLSGMTGTALTSSEEFYKVYGLETTVVPTNKPIARLDHNDQMYRTEVGKYKAVARKVKELHQKGQPVLIGTASIEKNEILAEYLKSEGVPHQVLNAKNHEREGEIIAQAGKKGAVTIATNLAGRGVDIKLGGQPFEVTRADEVRAQGGLFVLGTERHEARRIDNQLRGRSGRQGDPGETQFFVSLEDNLMRVFAGDTVRSMMDKLGMPEDQAIEYKLLTRSLETAQTKIEGFNFDSRKHVLDYDDVLNHQRKIVYGRRRKLLLGEISEVDTVLSEMLKEADAATGEKVGARRKEIGDTAFLNLAKMVLLQTIDMFWVEHLEVMDYLRSSVNLRAYGQRDPLVEYKKEGLRMFKDMESSVRAQVLEILPHAGGTMGGAPTRVLADTKQQADEITDTGSSISSEKSPTIGRNDPCYCGSGKKFKKCHGK
ncbi:MAG: preprotein translocase subunit SecA [Patescibacteria group bacterium]